ncbi:MAG: hypothetical protein ACI8QS_003091, partial [Planctomycetota bacterium]
MGLGRGCVATYGGALNLWAIWVREADWQAPSRGVKA